MVIEKTAIRNKLTNLTTTGISSFSVHDYITLMAPAAQKKPRPLFLEVFCRTLIIMCIVLSIVLSSIAVCDGHWLLSKRRMFGLWVFCDVNMQNSGKASNCTRQTEGGQLLKHGLRLCRCGVSLSVVSAIFGLELLVLSQVSGGQASQQRWRLGAWLVLLAAGLAAAGVMIFMFLLWEYMTLLGLTLSFWCQFTATFFFLFNGIAAQHIQNIKLFLPFSDDVGETVKLWP